MTLDIRLIQSYPSLAPADGCQETGEIILIPVMQRTRDWLLVFEANGKLPAVPVQRVVVNIIKM